MCNPWSLYICRSCALRPMKIYQGNDLSDTTKKLMKEKGYGMLVSGEYRTVKDAPYFAIDNGAFSAYKNGVPWDKKAFLKLIDRYFDQREIPDFIVVPDIVAGGLESLEFSAQWVHKIVVHAGTRKYLAVQDGMPVELVKRELNHFGGIFVGGSLEWKYKTAGQWIKLAHKLGMPCHIGRVGTLDKIVWASRIGADSIDSTSWGRNATYSYIEAANEQTILEPEGATP